ncbi:MAG TPA: NAD-dependent epimerase/dehydratase family protein, partial [Anaerolineales bacterium]|nr:NAD-dependent epimerase/dehydratase family protein [Anaerolineales bacterium]
KVRAFHRPSSSLIGLEGLPVEHALGDLTQPASVRAAMTDVEVVFHTAAMLGKPNQPERMIAVTVGGTRAVLEAAHEAGVRRVIHTSSVAALGVPMPPPSPTAEPVSINEAHTWNERPERWRYGHAKYIAELQVQEAVARGLDAVIVNPAVVLGPRDLNRVSGEVIVRVARGQVPVSTDGGLNVVHIADVVDGHLAALERGRTGERYILGGENLTHRAFLALIAEVTGRRPPRWLLPGVWLGKLTFLVKMLDDTNLLPIHSEALNRAGRYFYYDTQKAHLELGLPAPRPARLAIKQAYAWYRAAGII